MNSASNGRNEITTTGRQDRRLSRLQDLALLWFYVVVAGVAMSGWLWLLGKLVWVYAQHAGVLILDVLLRS